MDTQFPINDISRWGSWTVDRGGGVSSAMVSFQAEVGFEFVGTQAVIGLGADTGANGFDWDRISVSIDGGNFSRIPTANLNSTPQNITLSQDGNGNGVQLADGTLHTLIIRNDSAYYTSSYNWFIPLVNTVTISGANPTCSPLKYRPTASGKIIVFDGDSRTQGYGASISNPNGAQDTLGAGTVGNSYPAKFFTTFLDSSWTSVNQGCYSDTVAHILTRQASDVLTQFDPKNSRNVLMFWGGINDLNRGTTAVQLATLVKQYISNAKAAGVKEIIVGTIPYIAGQGPHDDQIAAYNADLRANFASAYGATGCADIDADQAFSTHQTNANWNADSLHLSDTGYGIVPNIFHTALNNQVSSSVPTSNVPAAPTITATGQPGYNALTIDVPVQPSEYVDFFGGATGAETALFSFFNSGAAALAAGQILSDNTVVANQQKYYTAKMRNSAGSSPASAEVNAITQPPPSNTVSPGLPSGVGTGEPNYTPLPPSPPIVTPGNNRNDLVWQNPPLCNTVYIQRRVTVTTGILNTFVTIGSVTATSPGVTSTVPNTYADLTAVNGTEYDYQLYATP